MDKAEAGEGCTKSGNESSRKRAAVSTHGERTSIAAQIRSPSDIRRLEDIFVPRRQFMEDEEVGADQLVRVRDVKDGAVLSFVWKNPEVVAYVRQDSRFLDAQMFGALPGHRLASKVMYAAAPVRRCTGPDSCIKWSGGRWRDVWRREWTCRYCTVSRKRSMFLIYRSWLSMLRRVGFWRTGRVAACCRGLGIYCCFWMEGRCGGVP